MHFGTFFSGEGVGDGRHWEFRLKFVEAVLNLRVVFTLSLQLPMDHIQMMPTATGPISQSRSFQEKSQSQE